MFEFLIEKLKAHPRKIVFTEGTDARILEASAKLLTEDYLKPVLVGKKEEIEAAAKAGGFDITGAEIQDPELFPDMEKMVAELVTIRKGKLDEAKARTLLKGGNYFGTMLVKMGYADALLGGATYSTADTVRPALQIIKTKPGSKIVSSCFIMVRPNPNGEGNQSLIMGDCAINIKPTSDELAEICIGSARTAQMFGIEPKIAMLSYSTKGSGAGEDVDKVREAYEKVRELAPDIAVEGEIQFDAAFDPVVAAKKCPGSPVAGQANAFIFPDINAANIGYKIAQRLGGFIAYGPIMQGLNAPINDLSRGCSALEVYSMAIVTAGLCEN